MHLKLSRAHRIGRNMWREMADGTVVFTDGIGTSPKMPTTEGPYKPNLG